MSLVRSNIASRPKSPFGRGETVHINLGLATLKLEQPANVVVTDAYVYHRLIVIELFIVEQSTSRLRSIGVSSVELSSTDVYKLDSDLTICDESTVI